MRCVDKEDLSERIDGFVARGATHFVYFIQAGGERGPIKIGYSKDLAKRIEGLRNGNHLDLRVLGICPCIDRNVARENELEFHSLFAELRERGEWFRWSQAVVDFIEIQTSLANLFFGTGAVVYCDLVWTEEGRITVRPRRGEP